MTTKGWVYWGMVGMVGCSVDTGSFDEPAGEAEQPFQYASGAVWDHTNISVCWTTGNSIVDGMQRAWVREVVEATFEPLTNLDFTGWGTCGSGGADIAIEQNAVNWPMSAVGSRAPSATPNMWLNHFIGEPRDVDGDGTNDFGGCWGGVPANNNPRTGITGREWPSGHRSCVEHIAIHEFFHALAVDHEQNNRNGAPSWCPQDTDGNGNPVAWGDTAYGYWDLSSTSNYCNPAWNNDAYLSQLDTAGLNFLYGWETNDRVWFGIGNVRDYGGANWDQLLFDQRAQDHMGTYIIAVGDFNGSDTDDILMYRPGSASDFIRYGRNDRGFEQNEYSITGTYQPIAGDFDGDGADDIYWHAPGSAADKLWFSNGNRTFDNTTPADITGTYTKIVAGDFDGDEIDDLFLYAAGSTADKVLFGRSDRTFDTVTTTNINSTYEPFAGDFDGDLKDDLFLYRPGTGSDSIMYGNSNRTFTSVSVTVNLTYQVTSGDFDRDGISDVLWNRSGENDFIDLYSTTRGQRVSTNIASIVGDATSGAESVPYAGDFDGDGFADVFWYKAN